MTSPTFGFFLCHVELMTKGAHDNDNYPILSRHPRLLAPVQQRDANRKQDTDRYSEDDDEKVRSELTVIEDRIKFLNWIEFVLTKKRTVANDRQVWPAGRFAS
jgi:hypothetical protein